MPARSTTPGLGAVACTPYGGALPSDHVSSMTLTETQMRLPCGQWNSFATSSSLAPLDARVRDDLGPSFDLGAHALILQIGRQCLCDKSDLAKFRLHVVLRQNLGRRLTDHVQGRLRCARGRIKSVPRRNLEHGHAGLGNGRNV